MSYVATLSSKFQILIPKDLRRRLKLVPGQNLVIIEKDGVLHLIPQRDIRGVEGFLKVLDVLGIRDEVDRF